MSEEAFILTSKDYAFLEAMLTRLSALDDPLLPLMRRKLKGSRVVSGGCVPPNVATMSSRVSFSIDGRGPDCRIIAHGQMTSPVGLYLPITTARGLAVLGLTEGQAFHLSHPNGRSERIVLERVLYQPEVASRGEDAAIRLAAEKKARPRLKLVGGRAAARPAPFAARPDDCDDPGPSAA